MTAATRPDEIAVEAVTMVGRAVAIIFRVKKDTVEVLESSARTGDVTHLSVIDRDTLARWLAEPTEPLVSYDLILEIDYHLDRRDGRLAITTRDVLIWSLSPAEEHRFTTHLNYAGLAQSGISSESA